jgi:hypothetical protein
MSSRSHRVKELFPEEALTFAPAKYDAALVGAAQRRTEVKPVYSWAAAKALFHGLAPEDGWKQLQDLLQNDDWLVLYSCSWREFWHIVRQRKLPRWDQLDKAVVGYVEAQATELALAYSMPLATSIMARSQADSSSTGLPSNLVAALFLERRLLTADLGEHTPWFITTVQ